MDITEVQKITLVPLKKHVRSCTLAKCEFYTKARISFAKDNFHFRTSWNPATNSFQNLCSKMGIRKSHRTPESTGKVLTTMPI